MDLKDYPKILGLNNLRDCTPFISNPLSVQLKRDGSNVGVYMVDGDVKLKTRNVDDAKDDVYKSYNRCDCIDGICDYLYDCTLDSVVFIELIHKGKSPARFESNERPEYYVIDIWWRGAFESPTQMRETCEMYDLPVIPQLAMGSARNFDDLVDKADEWRELAEGYEGIVVKTDTPNPSMFKHKFYKSPVEPKESSKPVKESMPEDEIYSTIHKILFDIDPELRADVTYVMPIIGKTIGAECREKNLRVPNLIGYYDDVMKEI